MTRDQMLAHIRDAQVAEARAALASPFMFEEGCELHSAREALTEATKRLAAAEEAWLRRVAPALEWAPDPLKEKNHG